MSATIFPNPDLFTPEYKSERQFFNAVKGLSSSWTGLFNSKKGIGKKWIVNFSINSKVDFEDVYNLSDDEIRNIINNFLDKISKIVEKVENKFLEHKNELLEMNNNIK